MFRPTFRPSHLSTISNPLIRRTFTTTPRSQIARMIIIGRLASDPEFSTTQTGQSIVKYVVGSNYGPKENRQVSWFRVAFFPSPQGTTQLSVMERLGKGTLVYVEADATLRPYQDDNGRTQTALNVVQRNLEILKRPYRDSNADAESTDAEASGST